MPKYLVRTNCEYSLEVEADSIDAAITAASKIDCGTWMQAWAPMEAEPVDIPDWADEPNGGEEN